MPNSEAIRPYNGGNEGRGRELEPRPFENIIVALDVDGVFS